jgi:acetyltransferase-like isoleucine patch superfamily enzyme
MIGALIALMQRAVCALCEAAGRGELVYKTLGKPDFLRYANWLRKRGVRIGDNTTVNSAAVIYCGDEHTIQIGRDCSISIVEFVTHSGGDRLMREWSHLPINSSRGIVIGDRCVIGSGAMIGPGVVIGDDCIVGFGTIVRKSLPSGVVVTGNPATVVGTTKAYRERQLKRALENQA